MRCLQALIYRLGCPQVGHDLFSKLNWADAYLRACLDIYAAVLVEGGPDGGLRSYLPYATFANHCEQEGRRLSKRPRKGMGR